MKYPDDFINQIICGDCLEVMKGISDNYIDLTVTSPPYDNLRDYKGYIFNFEGIANELFRVTKQGGVVVWVIGDATIKGSETGTSFKQALYFKEIGFNLHDTMIYAKNNPIILTHNRYEQQFEYMFIFSKGKPKTFNPIKILNKTAGNKKQWKRTTEYYKHENMANRSREETTIVKDEKNDFNLKIIASVPSHKQTANVTGFASSKIQEIRTILDPNNDKIKQAVSDGEKSIHAAAVEIRKEKRKDPLAAAYKKFEKTMKKMIDDAILNGIEISQIKQVVKELLKSKEASQ